MMFYSAGQIETALKCCQCKNKFTDPRILPCGYTLCNKCISDSYVSIIDCVCGETHEIPINGFSKNITIELLLDQQPQEVYRGQKVNELKSILNSMMDKMNSLQEDIDCSEPKIKRHCGSIKTEIIVNQVQRKREEPLKKAESYKGVFTERIKNQNLPQDRINEINSIYLKWYDYLENFDIDDSEIDKALFECKKFIQRLHE